jgi:hypothetical protein
MPNIGDLVASLRMDTAGFTAGAQSAIGDFHRVQEAAQEAGSGIASAFGVAGAFGIERVAERLVDSVKEQFEAVAALGHTAEKLDVPVNSLIALQHEAKMAHVDLELLNTSLLRMEKNVAEGVMDASSKPAAALRMMHISIEEVARMRPDQMFARIAEGISQIPDAASRAAMAIRIFGRSGAEMMNLLRQGRIGLDEAMKYVSQHGMLMSKEDIQAIQEGDRAIKQLGETGTTAFRNIAVAMAPFVEFFADPVEYGAKIRRMFITGEQHGAKLGEEMTETGESMAEAAAEAERMAGELKKAEDSAKGLTASFETPLERAIKKRDEAADRFAEGMISQDTFHRAVQAVQNELDKLRDKADEPFEKARMASEQFADSLKSNVSRAFDVATEAQDRFESGDPAMGVNQLAEAWERFGAAAKSANDKVWGSIDRDTKHFVEEGRSPLEKFEAELKRINDLETAHSKDPGHGLDHDQAEKARAAERKRYEEGLDHGVGQQEVKAQAGAGIDSKEVLQGVAEWQRSQNDNGAAAAKAHAEAQQARKEIADAIKEKHQQPKVVVFGWGGQGAA